MKIKYYIRVADAHMPKLGSWFIQNAVDATLLSRDFGNNGGTLLYSAMLDPEEALSMKLSTPIIGCMKAMADTTDSE